MAIPNRLLPHSILLKCDNGETNGATVWLTYTLTRVRCELTQAQDADRTFGQRDSGGLRVWIDCNNSKCATATYKDPPDWTGTSSYWTLRNGDRIVYRGMTWTITAVSEMIDRHGSPHHWEIDAARAG